MLEANARQVIAVCRELATCSEARGVTTRTFLSAPMRDVHARLTHWMQRAGMTVDIDGAGNLRGLYGADTANAKRLLIGSHLDTVPQAGAFDGVLGVVIGVALVDLLGGRRLPFAIEVIGFSEEEGVRFGVPFIGSRALVGSLDNEVLERRDASGRSVREAIVDFGLDPGRLPQARVTDALGYLEFHIEQGPVLDSLSLPLAVVTAIAGQSRLDVTFVGSANHAGTTPMSARRDALAGAAEWIGVVEHDARDGLNLVATVGRVDAVPGAGNVIAGEAVAALDVRHPEDGMRTACVERLLAAAKGIAVRRNIGVSARWRLEQNAVPMNDGLTALLARAVDRGGFPLHMMASGAGHDAMILAPHMPCAMLFLRSPGGVSHHPDENVLESDVAAALATGSQLIEDLAHHD